MYSRHFKAALGFHGCNETVANKVICKRHTMRASNNDHDWLGHGVYFWENNPERALLFAQEQAARTVAAKKSGKRLIGGEVEKPAVIGAVLDLGLCLDLTEQRCLEELKEACNDLLFLVDLTDEPVPINGNESGDHWNRKLDCAAINMVHQNRRTRNEPPYQSVRSPFNEGGPLYLGTSFTAKAHIQIAIIDPDCIKGTFWPRQLISLPTKKRRPSQ